MYQRKNQILTSMTQKLADANGNAWAETKVVCTWAEETEKINLSHPVTLPITGPCQAL